LADANDHIIGPYFLHAVSTESFHVEFVLHFGVEIKRNDVIQSFDEKIDLSSHKFLLGAQKQQNSNRTDHQRIE
jgi:hypothetical protein